MPWAARARPAPPNRADARRSGFDFMTPATQAMQRDDTQNPAMLSVADGEASWQRKSGRADKSCADCHGAAAASMRGVAARYPAFDARSGASGRSGAADQPVRGAGTAGAAAAARKRRNCWASKRSSRCNRAGLPIAPPPDPRLDASRDRGAQLYRQRMGQLDLACAQCHDDNAGKRLGGSVIPQAHPTAYPIYRLEWQGMGSLQRRLRGCMTGIRAEPFAYGSTEFVALELYLKARAAGMPMESPGVRP